MNWYLHAISAALVAFGTWYVTSDHYQKEMAQYQLEAAKVVIAQAEEHAAKLKKAGEQHATDQSTINTLRNAERVRIHIPVDCSVPDASQDQDGRAGVLSARVDEAFEKFQSGVEQLIFRCDQLNIDARASNNSQ